MEQLKVVTAAPFNAETLLAEQVGAITPNERHYVRNHFAMPDHPGTLTLDGLLRRPLTLSLDELRERQARSLVVTLECAGNGRGFLEPPTRGEQWGLGAVGTAEWMGVPLADLLADAQPLPDAVELLFTGADAGTPAGQPGPIGFERSLPIERLPTALVAYAMNGQPLPDEHGAPFRLLVPGWYGMASVKWLTRITAIPEPFRGFFQADRYVIDAQPIGPIAPRAVIVAPADGDRLPRGHVTVRGYAWGGSGGIDAVEVSVDGGESWQPAEVGASASDVAWAPWTCVVAADGADSVALLARAIDRAGSAQPLAQNWNALGYMNNAITPVTVHLQD